MLTYSLLLQTFCGTCSSVTNSSAFAMLLGCHALGCVGDGLETELDSLGVATI